MKLEKLQLKMKKRGFWKELWDFLWNSDSIWSWIADLILLWIIIKFILFPGLALLTGAAMPSVIIETGSMQHQTNCGVPGAEKLGFDSWWGNHEQTYSRYNISKSEFLEFKSYKGMSIGDIIILNGRNKDKLDVGDIIVYDAGEAKPIIHRIVAKHQDSSSVYYETYGDNNCGQFGFEKSVTPKQIIGKANTRIPKVGMLKIWTVNGFNFILKPFRK